MKGIPDIQHWRPVIEPPALASGKVHLWRIRTGPEGQELSKLWRMLSQQESERARRFRFDQHRERYVRAHGALRAILSPYISVEPQAIVFKYADAGKPTLDNPFSSVNFNLTTTGNLALVAVSLEEPIGVDCEQVTDCKNAIAIARRMFAPETTARIASAAPEDQSLQFRVAWTALEADVKVDGRGLFGNKKAAMSSALQIKHCVPEPGYIAAVACRDLPPVEDWVTLELTES